MIVWNLVRHIIVFSIKCLVEVIDISDYFVYFLFGAIFSQSSYS